MGENSKLPVPKDSFLAVLNYFAMALFVGQIEVAVFDRVINGLIVAADEELQGELLQLKLTIKRSLAGVG